MRRTPWSYALTILWRERLRFLPAVLAVTFSALLIALQSGVLLGTLSFTSIPIDECDADLFIGYRDVPSLNLGYPIDQGWLGRVDARPEVVAAECYIHSFGYWHKPAGGTIGCVLVGSRLEEGALGAVHGLTPELRAQLTELGTVAVDEEERGRLGLTQGTGEVAEMAGCRLRVVGMVSGYKNISGPFLFCSLRTARMLAGEFRDPAGADKTTYVLARCQHAGQADQVADELRHDYPGMMVFTRDQFSRQTRLYWMVQTRTGITLLFCASLALLVGLVVTSQTLYAATVAALREYALLRALGIPRWRIAGLIVNQSFWIGLGGVILALPLVVATARGVDVLGGRVLLPPLVLLGSAGVTLLMAVLSGLFALRSLRLFEPITLLR